MKTLQFVKLNPAHNTTAVITTPVDKRDYLSTAARLMGPFYLGVEQVGFAVKPDSERAFLRFEMPNDEFCGDGLLCAAVVAYRNCEECPEKFSLESSGLDVLVEAKVNLLSHNVFSSRIAFPLSYSCGRFTLRDAGREYDGHLVQLPGITHFLLEEGEGLSESTVRGLIQNLATLKRAKAYGVVTYAFDGGKTRINPCIFIPELKKLLFESACGSGTLALGVYHYEWKKTNLELEVFQPGGSLEVGVVQTDGGEKQANLHALVEVVSEGNVYYR